MTGSLLRVLVVDDEEPARHRLIDLLRQDAGVGQILEATDGLAAVDAIERERPDLVFLDVQMPELDGLGVVDAVGAAQMPLTVFVTAYDQHAVRAFEANAIDYLLKPVAPERLTASLAKLTRVAQRSAASTAKPPLDRVFVRDGERCWLVQLSDIVLLESEGNYTRLYFGKDKPLIPRSLAALEERLDSALFFRASRQHMVNLKAIEKIDTNVAGNLVVTLRGGHAVEMSRRQSLRLREVLSL
jgi:two-component system LytT family response regulator